MRESAGIGAEPMTLDTIRTLVLQLRVMDQVHDSVVATDLAGYIASWNRGAERLHGYTAAEAVGRHVSLVYPPEDRELVDARRLDNLLDTGFREFDAVARTKAGRLHPIHTRISLIRDAHDVPIGILSFAIDISELAKARAELVECERQLHTIFDAIPLVIGHADRESRLKYANKAYELWTGRSVTELIGRPIETPGVVDNERLLPDIEAVLGGTPTTSEVEVRRTDGDLRSLIVQRIPDVGEGGVVRGYFVVWADVTDIRRAESARIDEERRLREALIAEVHHRVKNSLQGVIGLLRVQAGKNPDLASALTPAISQVLSISVGFGLTSTRGERGVVVCDMVREIGRNIEQITGASIATQIDQTIVDRPVVIDRVHAVNLGLVVNELIFNAVKHGREPCAGPRVVVAFTRTAESATLRVSNRMQPAPFTLDFTAGRGLGTGLSLVKALLPQRGATLSFATHAGQVVAALDLRFEALGPVAGVIGRSGRRRTRSE